MSSRAPTDAELRPGDVTFGVTWTGLEPTLLHRRAGSSSQPVAARGRELAYQVPVPPVRHCLGSGQRTGDCYNPVQPPGSKHCTRCSIDNALHASSLHHAHTRERADIDPAVRQHLAQPNELYLAGFRDGSIKVGTSTARRTIERLTEQGAWMAVIVAATADGYRVRQLEDAVTNTLGIPQSVSTVRKLRGLVTPVDDHVLKTTLSATAADVTNMADFTAVGATTENRRWWHNPAADGPFGGRLFQYPHRLDTGTHDFVISDMCGRVAVVRPAGTDQLLVANLVQLFGIEHQVGHFPTSDIAIQDSLF